MLNGKLFVRKIIIWLLNLVEKFHLYLKINSKKLSRRDLISVEINDYHILKLSRRDYTNRHLFYLFYSIQTLYLYKTNFSSIKK